jgi:hypothetical protein
LPGSDSLVGRGGVSPYFCTSPSSPSDFPSTDPLRPDSQVANNLNFSSLSNNTSSSSVYIAHLDGAEKEFEQHVSTLLRAFRVREERIPRALSCAFSLPSLH